MKHPHLPLVVLGWRHDRGVVDGLCLCDSLAAALAYCQSGEGQIYRKHGYTLLVTRRDKPCVDWCRTCTQVLRFWHGMLGRCRNPLCPQSRAVKDPVVEAVTFRSIP